MTNSAYLYDIRTRNINYDERAITELSKGHVLEIGAGTGRLINTLNNTPNVKSYTGIELSSEMINFAKQKFPETLIIQDNFLTHQFKQTFDTVLFSFNVINEFVPIEEKTRALKKAKELLSPKGTILIFMPIQDFESWHTKEKLFSWSIVDDYNQSWDVKLEIKRDLIKQISRCQVEYKHNNLIVKDSYTNSLMTRNELLLLISLSNLNIINEFQGNAIENDLNAKYPELNDNILFVVK